MSSSSGLVSGELFYQAGGGTGPRISSNQSLVYGTASSDNRPVNRPSNHSSK